MAITTALDRLTTRLADAERLIEIHAEATGEDRGRRRGYDVLNRSAVMLAVAAWEGFAEDRLDGAVALIARRLRGPRDLPNNVRDAMLAAMYAEKNWSKLSRDTKEGIWSLAGTGWRQAYIQHAKGKISGLHTPDYIKLKKLYASVIGLPDIASDWKFRRWQPETYTVKLDSLLLLRHRIAHGSIGDETVGKLKAVDAVRLVRQLSIWTDGTTRRHLGLLPLNPVRATLSRMIEGS